MSAVLPPAAAPGEAPDARLELGRGRFWRDLRPLLLPLFGTQPRRLALGAALAALTVLMGMALLGLSGWFISATAIAGLQAATAIRFDVFMPSAGIRLLALGRTASRYGERLVTHDATFATLAAMREQLFRAWARPEAARRLLARPARLLFRLTADIDALESFYLRLLVPAGATLGAALLAGMALGVLSAWMGTLLALALLVAAVFIAWRTAAAARRPALRRAHAIEALRARAADLVAGQTELVMAGRSAAQCTALAAADRQLAQADLALMKLEAGAGMGIGILGSLALATVLLAVAALAGEGRIGAPAAALALLVVLGALEPFAALRRGALEASRAWLAARRLGPRLAALDRVGAARAVRAGGKKSNSVPAGARAAADPMASEPAIHLQAAVFTHPGSAGAALDSVSLHIGAGERVALIGPSGAGKSTLLGLIAGELSPQAGRLQVQPHCLLNQRTELFQDSLRDNLLLADPSVDDARLWDVLHAAGLEQEMRATARGLDTLLGEGGIGLSGGQARRLALARLLLRDVPLWLLDEASEGLDAATAQDVLQRLQARAAGRTLLIATHLRREAALADRLICLRAGRIDAELRRGTPEFEAALAALRPD